ncbi:unnamed protein product [Fraxinus pennsylvanica]|uniref:Uncharacterized protein n=1 Tax=Fraxinus pennsylvanica TaxID=56036 RepID=A0AAD2DPI0_9LAMI|nr:unnamed protein product [Fraxinus pennsylvanica]
MLLHAKTEDEVSNTPRSSFCSLLKTVGLKLALNPNSYACIIGMIWAFLANRRINFNHVESKAGTGTAFSMGLFMAMQEEIIACGASLTVFGMALRFIAGPVAMAIGSLAVGLHGDVLRVAIIQVASTKIHHKTSKWHRI